MQVLRIPKASENLETATIGRWLKREGDHVDAGEPIVEVLTDKADFALEAEEPGWLRLIAAPEKSTVPVGYVIGIVAQREQLLPDVTAENAQVLAAARAEHEPSAANRAAPRQAPAGKKLAATPAARRIAREHGLDLAQVAAALPRLSVISADDVQQFIEKHGPTGTK